MTIKLKANESRQSSVQNSREFLQWLRTIYAAIRPNMASGTVSDAQAVSIEEKCKKVPKLNMKEV